MKIDLHVVSLKQVLAWTNNITDIYSFWCFRILIRSSLLCSIFWLCSVLWILFGCFVLWLCSVGIYFWLLMELDLMICNLWCMFEWFGHLDLWLLCYQPPCFTLFSTWLFSFLISFKDRCFCYGSKMVEPSSFNFLFGSIVRDCL